MRKNAIIVIAVSAAALLAAALVVHYRTRATASPWSRPAPDQRASHEQMWPAPPAMQPAAPDVQPAPAPRSAAPAETPRATPHHPRARRHLRVAQATPATLAPPAAEPEPPAPPAVAPPPRVGPARPGQVSVQVHNRMGRLYVLTGVAIDLDGTKVFLKHDDSGRLGRAGGLPTFDWVLPPGHHRLVVETLYRGDGFGAFQYLERYAFTVSREYHFPVESGRHSHVAVDVVDKGDASLRLEHRADMRFNTWEGPADVAAVARPR
jgi:hypothetical protein